MGRPGPWMVVPAVPENLKESSTTARPWTKSRPCRRETGLSHPKPNGLYVSAEGGHDSVIWEKGPS